jgi:ribosomal protein L11 methyltransferase
MNDDFSLDLVAGSTAFGDGGHPTTQLALQAMMALATLHPFRSILDMGCGAGLLAMTAAHLWPQARIIAVDLEADAVRVAQENFTLNGLDIHAVRSDGCRHPVIQAAAPYDLMLCNITADTIVRLMGGLCKALVEDGVIVLSGVLSHRSAEILALFAQSDLHPILPTLVKENWEAHVLAKQ